MNILIISLFPLERNTSVANSSISIIKGIKALGHHITLVMPNWLSNETGCNLDGITIIRVPGQPNKPPRRLICKKFHSHFDFLDLTRGYLKQLNDICVPNIYYDVVLSFSDPKTSHIFAAKLLRKKHVQYGRWIQHWGDPIFGDITRNLWWPDWIIKWYEKRLIRKADKVVYVTPFTLDFLQKTYLDLIGKLDFVPLPAEMLPISPNVHSDVLRLSYLGDYNPSFRNLKPLYDACADLTDLTLTMAGHGPKYPKCGNVMQLPRIPQNEAKKIEDNSDVLVCVCNRTGTQIPGKIMYKTSTNKHILVAVEEDRHDEIVAYLKSFNRFIICDNTKEAIQKAILEIKGCNTKYKVPENLLPINVAKNILQ